MAIKPNQHKKPVIRVVGSVTRGNSGRGIRKDPPGGGLFVPPLITNPNQQIMKSLKSVSRAEAKKNALLGLLGGFIFSSTNVTQVGWLNMMLNALGSVLFLAGIVYGFVWIFRKDAPQAK